MGDVPPNNYFELAFKPNLSKWSRHCPITCGIPSLQNVFGGGKCMAGPLLWELAEHHQQESTPVRSQAKLYLHSVFSMCYCIRNYCFWTKRIPLKTKYKDMLKNTKTEMFYFSEKWKLHDKTVTLNILEYFYKEFCQVPRTIISSDPQNDPSTELVSRGGQDLVQDHNIQRGKPGTKS